VDEDATADVRPEQRAERAGASPVELDVLEQEKRRAERDLVLPQLGRGEDEEPLDVVAAEDDEPERAPLLRIEEQVDRLAEPDPVQPERQLQQLCRGPRPHSGLYVPA